MGNSIKVLFLAAEAEPFIKVGGLADVAGTLPLALRDIRDKAMSGTIVDVRLVLPLHPQNRIDPSQMTLVAEFPIAWRGGNLIAKVYKISHQGMPVYFIQGDLISSSPSVYSTDSALDRQKYAFFSMAALEMLYHIDWMPDIIHANDWHTALTLYALHISRQDPLLGKVRTLLTVHNLPFMGGDGADILSDYNLIPPKEEIIPPWASTQPLPLGLVSADAIIPVSPSYAREIQTPEFGCGLEAYLNTRSDSITGIMNGLDLLSFNPETDKDLASNFNVDTLENRTANKRALQESLGLPIKSSSPLLAMVGRIDHQKGVDIALNMLTTLEGLDWQFVILGSGALALETAAHDLQSVFPDRVRVITRYDGPLSRMIYGSADIFMMPSRYEPCGLAQMIAMHYGCVPVVRATGGLKDTVQEAKTGFLFQEASPEDMQKAVCLALSIFPDKQKWRTYQFNGMLEDFSWKRSAHQYRNIYFSLMTKVRPGIHQDR